MPPETVMFVEPASTAVSDVAVDELPVQLVEPSPRFSQAFLRSAMAEEPWAIKRSWLATVLRAEGLPFAMPPATEIVAASNFERIGGAMLASAAVIPIHGVITQRSSFWSWLFGGASLDLLRNALREVLADPVVSAVIFDIDSPGGSVDGLTEFAKELRSYRASGDKPIVAVVDPLAASAAYWIASQANEIVVTPSGEVGSIGVYAAHEDDSAAFEMMGVKITLISAGEYKTEGNPFEPLGDDARAAMQEQVDTFYAMFLSDVAVGRGVSVDAVASGFGEGRTFLAKKALQAGMVDRIGTLEETALRLARTSKPTRRAELAADTIAGEHLAVGGHGPELFVLPSVPAGGPTEAQPAGNPSPLADPAAVAASVGHPDRAWNARIAKRRRSR
jgi:signal peptide peptidase SppA